MRPNRVKANGVHYTPPALAEFLATVTLDVLGDFAGTLAVLDPACGDGALLRAFVKCLPASVRKRVVLHGYEMDPEALRRAREVLSDAGVRDVRLIHGDFLSVQGVDAVVGGRQLSLLEPEVGKRAADRFDAVIANPPYMGGKGMNGRLAAWLKDNYEDVKSDLFSAFIVCNTGMTLPKGQLGFMSPFVWMFISSYEKLRSFLINQKTITSLVQLEYSGFDGATVPNLHIHY